MIVIDIFRKKKTKQSILVYKSHQSSECPNFVENCELENPEVLVTFYRVLQSEYNLLIKSKH